MTGKKNKEESDRDPAEQAKRGNPKLSAGVAVGIGSAAIVAALLYAGRNRTRDKG